MTPPNVSKQDIQVSNLASPIVTIELSMIIIKIKLSFNIYVCSMEKKFVNVKVKCHVYGPNFTREEKGEKLIDIFFMGLNRVSL